jgi:Zn ribbon nucleic-acid-binding protein
VYIQCSKLMTIAIRCIYRFPAYIKPPSANCLSDWASSYERLRVLWDVKAEDEMNPCSVEVSNMTLTDETFRNKVCFRFVLQGRLSNLAATKRIFTFITSLVCNQCTKLMTIAIRWIRTSSSIVRCESGSHEMNQCSVEVSNMTLTDETLEIFF